MEWKSIVIHVSGRTLMMVIPAEVSDEDYLAQSYVKKQIAEFERNPESLEKYKKKLSHFAIQHDDDCRIFKRALCSCDADVQFLGEKPSNPSMN